MKFINSGTSSGIYRQTDMAARLLYRYIYITKSLIFPFGSYKLHGKRNTILSDIKIIMHLYAFLIKIERNKFDFSFLTLGINYQD